MAGVGEVNVTEAFEDFERGHLWMVLMKAVVVFDNILGPNEAVIKRNEEVDRYIV